MAEPVSNINDAGSPVSGADRVKVSREELPTPPPLPGTPVPEDRILPQGDRSNPRLNAAAEKVGGAVGSAVGSVRRAGSRLRVVGGRDRSRTLGEMADPRGKVSETAGATISDLKDSAAEKMGELKDRATDISQRAGERLGEFKDRAGEHVSDFAETARDRMYYARQRARHLANEYPVQTILGFAGLAFVIGFALRIWRSNGD